MTSRRAACLLVAGLVSASPAFAAGVQAQTKGDLRATVTQTTPPAAIPQTPPPTTAASAADPAQNDVDLSPLPVDLARIKRVLERTPTTPVDQEGLRFYMEIIARHPTFKDLLGNFDLRNGPVPHTAMTHAEFVQSVTPKWLNSSAGFNAADTLQSSLVNWAAQNLIKKAVTALKNARSEAQIREINQQIDRELAALRGGG